MISLMTQQEQNQVTGKSLSSFRVEMLSRFPSREQFMDLLTGKAAAFHVQGFLGSGDASQLVDNFDNNEGVRVRDDVVPASTVGVDLFLKDPEEYLAQTKSARPFVDQLFEGCSTNIVSQVATNVQKAGGGEYVVRAASANGVEFNRVRAVRWTGNGELALKFHDDLAQHQAPIQSVFETSRVSNPLAFNVYPQVPRVGGELIVFNIKPDFESKFRLGIAESGYPYEPKDLDGYESVRIRPSAGDLVILAGSFVHGVASTREGERLLFNMFGGVVDGTSDFVMWS